MAAFSRVMRFQGVLITVLDRGFPLVSVLASYIKVRSLELVLVMHWSKAHAALRILTLNSAGKSANLRPARPYQ